MPKDQSIVSQLTRSIHLRLQLQSSLGLGAQKSNMFDLCVVESTLEGIKGTWKKDVVVVGLSKRDRGVKEADCRF